MTPVDVVFTKLQLVYGKRFSAAYEGMPAGMVRQHWEHELRGVAPEAITWALTELPADFPPNVLQFRAICSQYRPPMRQLIARERKAQPMPERFRSEFKRLQAQFASSDPLDGARNLKRREENGEHLTRVQREFWRKALKENV
jgi:hypothetical protein